ncbi:MAG TPA: carboxypeptidase-like regulatory domain-containing protein, partial [Bryobacteraceae bacterium]|nr:carboxypeptidase-like regulatory domain-containing protein [Bryobacteraceae bacterium]
MRREWLLILFLFSLAAATADAQVTTGTILGIVTDSTGAAVSGAQITITNVNRGTTQQYTTDATGSYTAPFLVPGTYRVEVEKAGFKRATSVDTQLEVDQKARVDFSMQLGQVSETVTVEAAAPLVRSETAELGEVVNQHSVETLPL